MSIVIAPPSRAIWSRSGTSCSSSIAITCPAPKQHRTADRELAHRTAAPHRDGIVRLNIALLRRHVAGREDVRQETPVDGRSSLRHLLQVHVGQTALAGTPPARPRSRRSGASSRERPPWLGPRSVSPMAGLGIRCCRSSSTVRVCRKSIRRTPTKNGTTTRSPTFTFVPSTPGPSSSTMPIGSWPSTSPGFMNGMKPSTKCKIRPADACRRDPHDCIAFIDELRFGNFLNGNLIRAHQTRAFMIVFQISS